MPNVDHVRVGSTSYDISPSPTGTLTTGTGGFSSSDVAQANATSWTSVDQITTSDNHASIFTKITQMVKNVRYLYNVLGTGFSTGSTVKNQIDGKATANHSHKVAQLPTSSTQVNSNDYIPTSALIYSMNQTLTSLNDASTKICIKNITSTNSLIILNGSSYDDYITGDLDAYKYHILECRSDKIGRFILPGYLANKPTDDFPYDYIWSGYIYMPGYIMVGSTEYPSMVILSNETLHWKFFCIPR